MVVNGVMYPRFKPGREGDADQVKGLVHLYEIVAVGPSARKHANRAFEVSEG
jgi:hypothetical protein